VAKKPSAKMPVLRTPDGLLEARPCKGGGFLVRMECPGCHRDPIVVQIGQATVSLVGRWLMPYDAPDRVICNASAFCTGCKCLIGALQHSVVIQQEE